MAATLLKSSLRVVRLPRSAMKPSRTSKCLQMREKYRLGAMDKAHWLDPVTLSRVDQLIAALADPEELRKHRAYQTEAEAGLRTSPTLILQMPYFAHPIIHEEKPYPGVPGGGVGVPPTVGRNSRIVGGVAAADGMIGPAGVPFVGEGEGSGLGEGGRSWGASDLLAGGGADAFLLVSDFEMEADNPVEDKYRKLAHDQLRGLVDPELKPNKDERHRIDELVAGRQDHLQMEDRDLLWKFRYCLTDNKRCGERDDETICALYIRGILCKGVELLAWRPGS